MNALTARTLGAKLGSSARPVFTVFQSMEHVQQEVTQAARQLYTQYISQGLSQTDMPAFKAVGMQYIRFALDQPRLFQLLFMSEQAEKPSVAQVLPAIDGNYSQILSSVQACYSLKQPDAAWLYRHLWIYTHGVAVLCATNMCAFTDVELSRMLTEVCSAMLHEIKGDIEND